MYNAFHTHVRMRLGLIFDSHILMHSFLQRFSSHGETKREPSLKLYPTYFCDGSTRGELTLFN